MIKTTDKVRLKALAVEGNNTHWVYNFFVMQKKTFLGIPFWSKLHASSFVFRRYTNSPHADGLDTAFRNQKEQFLRRHPQMAF